MTSHRELPRAQLGAEIITFLPIFSSSTWTYKDITSILSCIKNKSRIYLSNIYAIHRQLFKSNKKKLKEPRYKNLQDNQQEFLTPDWLLYYGNYIQHSRYPKFTYGKAIMSARIWEPEEKSDQDYLINFWHTFSGQLRISEPLNHTSTFWIHKYIHPQQENQLN